MHVSGGLIVTDMETLKQIGDCTAETLRTRRKELLINITPNSVDSVMDEGQVTTLAMPLATRPSVLVTKACEQCGD
jgi:hypothetical protein